MHDWNMYFVGMTGGESENRVIYEASVRGRLIMLSQQLVIPGKGTSLLFSEREIDHIEVEYARVLFRVSPHAIECPLVAIFNSFESALTCSKSESLTALDDRWVLETSRNVLYLRMDLPRSRPKKNLLTQVTCA